jgi:ketosteroid isomerase-like protein
MFACSLASSGVGADPGDAGRDPASGRYWSAMSHETVEIVRRSIDHLNETGELLWAEIDPDMVWVIDPPAFLAGTYHGHEGVRTILRGMADVFDQVRLKVDEFVEAGDSVVMLGGFRVRGALSGATAPRQELAIVIRLRDRRIAAYRAYLRREDPLEAAGLQE